MTARIELSDTGKAEDRYLWANIEKRNLNEVRITVAWLVADMHDRGDKKAAGWINGKRLRIRVADLTKARQEMQVSRKSRARKVTSKEPRRVRKRVSNPMAGVR